VHLALGVDECQVCHKLRIAGRFVEWICSLWVTG